MLRWKHTVPSLLLFCCLPFFLFATMSKAETPMSWQKVTEGAPWGQRDSGAVFSYDDKLWIAGGYIPDRVNDVWASEDGAIWTQVTEHAAWSGRNCMSSVVYNDTMWIMGGASGPTASLTINNDVWSSTDGATWTEITPNAAWNDRSGATSVVFDDKMWILGGMNSTLGGTPASHHYNDVWYSSDGASWTQATEQAGWSVRNSHASVVFNDKMWVLGGGIYCGGTQPGYAHETYNDVWSSSDGENWDQAVANAPWEARMFLSAAVYDDKMWVLAGGTGYSVDYTGNRNDVWYSSDGVHWTELTPEDDMWAIRHAPFTVVHDDGLWVMGGYGQTLYDDVWVYYVPEPATVTLFALSGVFMAISRNRREDNR